MMVWLSKAIVYSAIIRIHWNQSFSIDSKMKLTHISYNNHFGGGRNSMSADLKADPVILLLFFFFFVALISVALALVFIFYTFV